MSKNMNYIINRLGPAQRRKVEARAAQLIAEEMTLQELRRDNESDPTVQSYAYFGDPFARLLFN